MSLKVSSRGKNYSGGEGGEAEREDLCCVQRITSGKVICLCLSFDMIPVMKSLGLRAYLRQVRSGTLLFKQNLSWNHIQAGEGGVCPLRERKASASAPLAAVEPLMEPAHPVESPSCQ